MGRRDLDGQARTTRVAIVAVVWLCGLAAGIVAILAAVAKYGCAPGRHTLGCRTSGAGIGIGLLVVVLAVLAAVTLLAMSRSRRQVLLLGAIALVILIGCYLGAQGVLDTT